MRISDDRYSRDHTRLDIALRFIRLEARTRTIRTWTGLSDDRIRKLHRSYATGRDERIPTRHRGKSPHKAAFFMRSERCRQETALLASLCCLVGALPTPARGAPAPTLARAELLCQAYDTYCALVGTPLISFEHAVFLLTVLGSGEELTLASCPDCQAALVGDRCCLRPPRCAVCGSAPEPIGRGGERGPLPVQ